MIPISPLKASYVRYLVRYGGTGVGMAAHLAASGHPLFGSPPLAGLCFIQLSIAYGNRIPEKQAVSIVILTRIEE
mgnify:CR=1 FL=1